MCICLVINNYLCGRKLQISMDNEPHIGHIIKQELRRQGRTITWLATQLGYSRQNMYKLFERNWIYTDLLLKISGIMDCDFFKYYSKYLETRNE